MAFGTKLQENTGTFASSSTLAYLSNITANSGLFAMFAFSTNTGSVTSITDTLTNTWTQAVAIQGATAGATVEIWYAHSPSGGANTISFTVSGSPQIVISEHADFTSGVSVDQFNSHEEPSGSTTVNCGSITTTQSATVIVNCWRNTSAFSLNSRGDGFTGYTAGSRQVAGYLVPGSTTTVDADLTFAASELGVGAIAAFYTSAGGSTYNDSVSFSASASVSDSGLADFADSVSFTIVGSVSDGGVINFAADTIAFDAVAATDQRGGAEFNESISFAVTGDVSDSGPVEFGPSLSFSQVATQDQSSVFTGNPSLTLSVVAVLASAVSGLGLNRALILNTGSGSMADRSGTASVSDRSDTASMEGSR